MAKIAFNNSFGGFHLSDKAVEALLAKYEQWKASQPNKT